MSFPDFFDQVPTITVHDGLAEMLGACTDGMITYRYIDAVRLAGHSCPTVAGAYLMTRRALNALYPDGTPERGALRVRFAAAQDEGVSGVIGSVIGLITGAAGIGGFKGIGGNFQRQHLLQYGVGGDGEVVFERGDNGAAVRLSMHMQRVPADPGMSVLLRKILDGVATPDDKRGFATLWQGRVQRILIDHVDDPELFTVTALAPPAAQ
ncbi:hypothetical protein H3H37_16230 [Duganella sp. LX20W]|uniref:Formylmethanofuran dehydrogenase subunit E domain-containing protein n=1 Tax=Rugamonas brunnea TaxID=2758569 RepID=A0A7W2ICQ8_9BURK|nr:FmdE family protein [Rugamonas brunnea]MBA5638609.1 hypothetical protein [Rugamonas brunnea]